MNLLRFLKRLVIRREGRIAFSQEGEDLVLSDFFVDKISSGFFVDVGAHAPKRFSNTYLFYKRGWRGINIDPVPGMKKKFDRVRSRDINLEIGIARTDGVLKYFEFNEPALNGFDEELSKQRHCLNSYRIVGTKNILVRPLAKVLSEYLPLNQHLDFMTIDVEGLDLEVLESNDWQKFRPQVVVVEVRKETLDKIFSDPIYHFMVSKKYALFASTGRSSFFKDINSDCKSLQT